MSKSTNRGRPVEPAIADVGASAPVATGRRTIVSRTKMPTARRAEVRETTVPEPTVIPQTSLAPLGTHDTMLWNTLRYDAQFLYDVMKLRTQQGNRASAVERGASTADIVSMGHAISMLEEMEAEARRTLKKQLRICSPAIAAWSKEVVGLDEAGISRLLGAIGDPLWATPHHWEGEGEDRHLVDDEPFPRGLRTLWAYCGVGDPTRRRRKGMSAEDAMKLGVPQAKSVLYTLSDGTIKSAGGEVHYASGKTVNRRRSPYRDVYDARRAATNAREDWTLGHKHADALRIVGKEILRDLFNVALTERQRATETA